MTSSAEFSAQYERGVSVPSKHGSMAEVDVGLSHG
jgi:hypothetical protein